MSTSLRSLYFRWISGLLLAYLAALSLASLVYQWYEIRKVGSHGLRHEVMEVLAVFGTGAFLLPAMLLVVAWLTGRMVRPLSAIRITAERINNGCLDERIPAGNPDDELGRLVRIINSAFDRYRESLDRLQRFASDTSHQLRTPLTSIRTSGEVCLQKERTPEEYRETIGSMLEDVQRLSDLVEKLLLIARLGADRIRSSFTSVDLGQLVREVAARYEEIVDSRTLHLAAVEGVRVRGDAELLRQLLSNLLDNAVRHTPKAGEIRVGLARRADGMAVLSVRDSGPGVSPEIRQQLFRRFSRGPGTDVSGTGLGLAIASDIVGIHGGSIELLEGNGAHFVVTLPTSAS